MNLQRQMDSFYDSVADLKANLASITSDKERYFQEKLDLHQKLQNTILERETVSKNIKFIHINVFLILCISKLS